MATATNHTDIIDKCYKKILNTSKRPLLIAITGDSGSGKSYYSQLLIKYFDIKGTKYTYINADDFLIPRADRESMKHKYYDSGEFKGKSYWEILENMFYLDKFGNVINSLGAGQSATYCPYLRETGKTSEHSVTVHPNEFILFDTSMLLEKMDFIILVDVTRENIIQRKLERDKDIRAPDQIVEMHNKVQGYYWDRKQPRNPDIIIDNNDYAHPKLVKI